MIRHTKKSNFPYYSHCWIFGPESTADNSFPNYKT